MSNKKADFTFCKNCKRPGHCGYHNQCRKPCLICGGDGTVNGRDYYDWQDDEYNDPFASCPSCRGSGLAKDMTWC